MTGKLLWFVYLAETETGVVGVVREKSIRLLRKGSAL